LPYTGRATQEIRAGTSAPKGTAMYYLFKRLWQEEDAQDLAEYALLLMLVSLTAVVALHSLAATTNKMFFRVAYAFFFKHRAVDW
jgi:Flp pilus assembly pilin Flp